MNSTDNNLLYNVALTMLPNVGSMVAKNLIAYCGSAENVFKASKGKLEKIPMIGAERAAQIAAADVMKDAEDELKFIEKYNIEPIFFTGANYPYRLKECTDSPVMLYYMGNADLNAPKIVGVVGTRRITDYGKEVTKKLVADLAAQNVLVVSGLAYGVDTVAHSASLDSGLQTVGVLAHGLNTIYPAQNKSLAKRMVAQGGLLSEYRSVEEMHPSKFPSRNRIVAGMCDAVVVIESAAEGGALITANIANSYNRDVFAYPGRANDKFSAGCNFLIKTFKAKMIDSADDLLKEMNWLDKEQSGKSKVQQRQLALTLNNEEQGIYNLLTQKGELPIDEIADGTQMNVSILAATLLEMEMNSIIVSLPGKRYKLI
ncbi:MAG TPA: DNA-processing protein DprA [Chitinophagales bacterium]|nr:DNA-processing protein DprA [Chitinophagales bacterium]